MSRRAPRCCSLKPVGTFQNPYQCTSTWSKANGSIPPIILGVSLDTQLIWSTHIDYMRRKVAGWECRDLSYTEVVSPSAMKSCFTSRWSVLWWTTHSLHGDLPFAHFSGNCRCFSPSVFTLLPMHLGSFVTSKIMVIWESLSLRTTSDLWGIWLKMWGNPNLHSSADVYADRGLTQVP
jgi:hypothetical protein